MVNEIDPTKEKWFNKYFNRWELYPHMILDPEPENAGWRCLHCKVLIPWGEPDKDGLVSSESPIGCTERHTPCKWCGEQPLCAPDCVGIRMLLSDPKVYVIGDNPFPEVFDCSKPQGWFNL